MIYYHPAQALVQIYIIVDITGCKKDTKTVSYLLYYLFPIYHIQVFFNQEGIACYKIIILGIAARVFVFRG